MSVTKQLLSFASFLVLFRGCAAFAGHGATRHGSVGFPYALQQRHRDAQPATTRLAVASNLFARPSSLFKQSDKLDKTQVNNRYSASDWLHNVFSLPHSTILRKIRNPVVSIAIWSAVVSILHRLMSFSSSKILQKVSRDMCIGHTPHSFLVSSLGLLLVFRTNSAYQRFYEGRKIWENILTTSRNLSRMTNLYSKEVGSSRQLRITNLLASFPYLLRHHIREGCLCEDPKSIPKEHRLLLNGLPAPVIDTRFEGDRATGKHPKDRRSSDRQPKCFVDKRKLPWSLFEPKSLRYCARAQNRPLWVCDRIGREIMSIPYGPNYTSRERLSLLSQVNKLTKTIGECERIHQTAVPLNYARHSLRSLTLWLFTLPFALIKDLGLLTGPVMGVIAWLLFGVYQIGYSIEDPFQGSLRLSILCDAIRKDVVGETESRDSAFSLDDTWAEEDYLDEQDMLDAPSSSDIAPILPDNLEQGELILQQPTLVKENSGSWNVVGVVEG